MELKHIGMVSSVQTATVDDLRVKKDKAAADDKKDQLELSGEAKELMQTRKNAKIELMKARVESGYYFSDEVTEKTAEKILKSL
ncbi:MAG TPA: flagellar biosynthesis anti-sigma factor FlgM [Bacteroidota bacterium]|nr:flagellar biosynthesis anti-sigma factor FlgM [Bacteroidota bacterium]